MTPDSIRVLVVDDHEVVRRGISALLGQIEDIEVVGEAGNGTEAIGQAFSAVEICPSDPEIVYAGSDSAIYRSEDSGLNWSRMTSDPFSWGPPGVRAGWPIDLQCDPDNTNRIFANNYSGGNFLSEDGGKTWVKQESPVPYYLMGVYFADAQRGWIVTERTTILYTENGGKTWEIQFQDNDFILKDVSFCDDHTGWAVGEYGFIYHTADGGKTWRKQAGEFGFSDETGEIIGGNILFDVVAIDVMTAWAVGIDGYVIRTTDSGKTWKRVKASLPNTHLFGISTDKKNSVVIGGDGCILSTSLNGEGNYRPSKTVPPITYGWIYAIESRGTSGFIAVGDSGQIYSSDNKAMDWQKREY